MMAPKISFSIEVRRRKMNCVFPRLCSLLIRSTVLFIVVEVPLEFSAGRHRDFQ